MSTIASATDWKREPTPIWGTPCPLLQSSEKLSKRRKEAEERRRNEREASPERKARLRRQKLEERERALQAMEAELRDGEEEVQQESQVHRPVLVSGSGPSDNPLDDAMAQEDPAQAIVLTRDARPMPFV